MKEAAHQFRERIPEDGHWTRENFQPVREAHQQLVEHTKDLKQKTGDALTAAVAAKDATAKNVDEHKDNVAAHDANVQAHADNCDAHDQHAQGQEEGSDAANAAKSDHDNAKNAHDAAKSDHDNAKSDADQAQSEHDDNCDNADGSQQNDDSAGTVNDLLGTLGSTLTDIEGKLGDAGHAEDNDLTTTLKGCADDLVKHVEDTTKWHDKALDCDAPPAAAPSPPTTTPTTPNPPASAG